MEQFKEIVRTYSGYVYTITYHMLRNVADAEDAAQETFIKVYKKLQNYNEAYELKPWLSTIAMNTARDIFRKTKHGGMMQSEVEIDQISCGSEASQEVHNQLDVAKMLSCLDIRYRSVVILFYMERYSIKEISGMLKKSENVVKVWLHRARKMLTKQYGDSVI